MPVSDEEVQQARDRVADLSAQIAAEESRISQEVRDNENGIRLEQLNRQADEMEARLNALRERNAAVVNGETSPMPTTTPSAEQQKVTAPADQGKSTAQPASEQEVK